MKKNKSVLNIESPFAIQEMFFSITDPRGIILACNEVFARVSKIEIKDLIGKPHNVIRHPDMPKAIFKLLWEEIKAGRPITAYVKNLASDGSFYWVLATVFPVEGKYVSIRVKPSAGILDLIIPLYAEMVGVEEKTGSMEESTKTLLSFLEKNKFDSYQTFMANALSSELLSRYEKLSASSKTNQHKLQVVCSNSLQKTKDIALSIKEIMSLNTNVANSVDEVLRSFTSLKNLVLNLTIASNRIGSSATSMATVSEIFGTQALNVEQLLSSYQTMLEKASDERFLPLGYKIMSASLQMAMVEYFFEEIFRATGNLDQMPDEVVKNCIELVNLSKDSLQEVYQSLMVVSEELIAFKGQQKEFTTLVDALQVLHQMGKIELAKIEGGAKNFSSHLEGMNRFIGVTKPAIKELGNSLDKIQDQIKGSTLTMQEVISSCGSIDALVNKVKVA